MVTRALTFTWTGLLAIGAKYLVTADVRGFLEILNCVEVEFLWIDPNDRLPIGGEN
jgi:hypothetical protein